MRELEAHLRGLGVGVARLMTGTAQPEAVALYASLGYTVRAPYGGHAADAAMVFMEKQLFLERPGT